MSRYNSSSSILTNSNLSLDSIDDDEVEPWHGLYHKLTKPHLEALQEVFVNKTNVKKDFVKNYETQLNKEEFVKSIDDIFGNSKYSLQASLLFSQIDKQENRCITWNQFLDFIIDNFMPTTENQLGLKMVLLFNPPHVKKETIIKIVLIKSEKYFCYAVIAKHGRVGIYDGNMNFLTTYHAIMTKEDLNRKDEERKQRNRWITDAIFIRDLFLFVITTTARNITIYDASGLKHTPLWLILGIQNVVQCLSYVSTHNSKMLFLGNDHGQIIALNFLRPKVGLLRRKHDDKISIFYWIELQNEDSFVAIKHFGKLFKDSVRRIQTFPDNGTFAACCSDPICSVLIKAYGNNRKSYVFKMERGVTCFLLSRLLKIMISGNAEGIIEIWNTVGTKKPVAKFKSHRSEILDIQIMESQELFLSISKDGVLKLWDIKDEKCIQTVKIKFPSFQILGKTIEWGINAIYASPKRYGENIASDKWEGSHFYVTCCNHIAKIDFRFHKHIETVCNSTLPPPPLQNSALIPSPWKFQAIPTPVNIPTEEEEQEANEEIVINKTDVDDDLLKRCKENLELVFNRNFFKETNSASHINAQIANIECKKLEMKFLASNCAPYLTLDLQNFKEIRLSSNLPVPCSRKVKSTIEKIQNLLTDVSVRDRIFSEVSSEQSKGFYTKYRKKPYDLAPCPSACFDQPIRTLNVIDGRIRLLTNSTNNKYQPQKFN